MKPYKKLFTEANGKDIRDTFLKMLKLPTSGTDHITRYKPLMAKGVPGEVIISAEKSYNSEAKQWYCDFTIRMKKTDEENEKQTFISTVDELYNNCVSLAKKLMNENPEFKIMFLGPETKKNYNRWLNRQKNNDTYTTSLSVLIAFK